MSKVSDYVNSMPDKRNAYALAQAFDKLAGRGIVAAVGSSQATAAALAYAVNMVTGADATKAVRLPIPQPDDPAVWVINTGSSDLPVYPAVDGQINALGTDAAFTLGAGQFALFQPSTKILWYTAGATTTGTADLAKIDGITNGTIAAGKAIVVDANKDAGDARNFDVVNLDAGASGTAGTVDVFPATASKGKLILAAVNNDGDTNVTLSNAAMGQASVISFPDPGAATANVVLTSAANDGAVVTATSVELNYNDITTLGTGAASKAVVLDAGEDYTWPAAGILTYGVLKDPAATTITSTGAEINLLDGSVVGNSVASKAAMVDSEKKVQTNANNGTVETGVTAVHYGDGVNVTAVLTLTNVVITVGTSQSLGVGSLLYTLPAGACLIRDAYMSVGISGVSTTTDTPDVGLGTVVASGAVITLDGTATFENIITGQTIGNTNGTPAVKGAGPTGGNPLEITTAGAHTVYFNAADAWAANADASGLLNGTVVISYVRQNA